MYYYVEQIEGSFKDNTKPIMDIDGRLPKNIPGFNPTTFDIVVGTEKIAYTFKLQFDGKMFHLGAFSLDELDSWHNFFQSSDPQKKVLFHW